jgi:hypothetical protein
MKESMPHHAENHGLAPGPGKASKLWTFILFLESEGGQDNHPNAECGIISLEMDLS